MGGNVAKQDDEDRYIVVGYVDSENGFGANIRTDWILHLKYNGGEWTAPSNWEVEEMIIE